MHAQLLWMVSPIGHDALEDRMIEEIRSRSNQWIKKALQLKQRKYRQAYGMFLMEGLRSVEDALRQGMKACTCFFTENQLENERFKALMKEGEALSWRFLKLDEGLMKLISGTQHGQGIMLLASKKKRDIEELMHPLEGYYVLLDAVQDPGNMGTILRSAAAAGVKAVLLTKGCTDPFAEKAVRSSMGSILRVLVYEDLTVDQISLIREKSGLALYGTALSHAVPYKTVGEIRKGIFVFGNEGNGIREELLAMTDMNLYIPLAGTVESLNVSVAAAVILFQFIE